MKRPSEESVPIDFLTESICRKLTPFVGTAHVELEVRLCIITKKESKGERLRLPIDSPAVLVAPHNVTVGVEKNHFATIRESLLERGFSFSKEDSHTLSFPDGSRVTRSANGTVQSYVMKRKLCTIDILVPGYPYDIRIALASETPIEEEVPTETAGAFSRQRQRESTSISSDISIELTTVGETLEIEVEKQYESFGLESSVISHIILEAKNILDALKRKK